MTICPNCNGKTVNTTKTVVDGKVIATILLPCVVCNGAGLVTYRQYVSLSLAR